MGFDNLSDMVNFWLAKLNAWWFYSLRKETLEEENQASEGHLQICFRHRV